MTAAKLHADEIGADVALVRRLLTAQFPQWADLPVSLVATAGTDNWIFRLSTGLCARLPRRPSAAALLAKECLWLPRLQGLPLAIPQVAGVGQSSDLFPWPWAVVSWLPATPASPAAVADASAAAHKLAEFVTALHAVPAAGGPPSGPANHERGVPLARLDTRTRDAIASLASEVDARAATALWEEALAAPPHPGPLRWLHGDLQPGNLLCHNRHLAGVIALAYYRDTEPALAAQCRWTLSRLLGD